MKHLAIIALMTGLGFVACNAQSAQPKQEKTATATTNAPGVISLNKEAFLKNVVNYEANPKEWKYLGNKPAIIDFYATWCGPCKKIAPVLEELAKEYKDQIVIYKIDTDKEKELAQAFGIRSIPTLLFVPMEGEPQMSQGALPKEELKKAIQEVLLKK